MKLKLLIIGLLFINCANKAQEVEPIYTIEVSVALQPYVFEYMATLDKYEIEYKKQSFIVVFDSDIMRTPLVGRAQGMFNDELVYVRIDPREWGYLTPKQRKHLIFHELSHDIFNVLHTEDIELMKPSLPSDVKAFAMDIDKEIAQLMKYIKNGNK
tara:strand:+ start:57 stop:524 length:468 start_codon:yes stop_codon:yes gene_type:complete